MNLKSLLREALHLILDLSLILLGVLGSLLCLCSAFDFPVPEHLFLLTGILALGFCLVLGLKRGRLWGWLLLALLLGLGWLLRHEIWDGLLNLWGVLGVYYAKGYSQVRIWLPQGSFSRAAAGPGILALGVGMTFVVSLSVRRWRRTLPGALALLLGVAPCFILTDTPPDLLPLLAAAFSVLTQAFSQAVRRRSAGEEGRSVLLGALLGALLLSVPMLIWPREGFSQPVTWEDLADTFDLWALQRENRGNIAAGLSGTPPHVDLSSLGPLPNRPMTALRVTSEIQASLYLRATSYTEFDGFHWDRGELRDWEEQTVYPYLGQEMGSRLRIETVDRENTLYTAYYPSSLPAGGLLVGDYCLRNGDKSTAYSMTFLPEVPAITVPPEYRQWVLDTSLDLPETTRESVMAWWSRQPESLGEYRDELALAEAAAKAVSRCAAYSRDPDPVPDDAEDFPGWFLNEAQKGYCVHFASSATALLRALGVPARYATGYVCEAPAGREIDVTNLQAHAWVEVFYQGCWHPIEPTPEEATEFTGDPEPLPSLDETTETGTDQPGPSLVETTAPREAENRQETSSRPDAADAAQATPERGSGAWLWILPGLALLLGLTLGRRLLLERLRARRIARARGNERARLYYRRALALSRRTKTPLAQEAETLAYKAGFSQHDLDREELGVLRQCMERQIALLEAAPLGKRLWYKYGLCIF